MHSSDRTREAAGAHGESHRGVSCASLRRLTPKRASSAPGKTPMQNRSVTPAMHSRRGVALRLAAVAVAATLGLAGHSALAGSDAKVVPPFAGTATPSKATTE